MRRSVFWLLDHYPDTGESLASLYATALAQARLADRLGYTGLWLAEHHFQKLGTAPNPAVLLSAIAQCTENLRLGPAVAVLPLRDPVLVAEDYALVDALSGGRLDMGVGTGSRALEFEGLAHPFERRQEVFDAHLAALLTRWRAAAEGQTGPQALNVAPVQRPVPPVYVAAMHEESARTVGLQGHSLLTLVSPMTGELDEVAARVAAHAEGLAKGGHEEGSAGTVVVVFAHTAATDDAAREVAAPALGRFIEALVGVAPDDPGDLYDRMRERSTGVFGSPEHTAKQVERHAELGVDHLAFITRFGGMDAGAAEWSLRRLAPGDG